MTGTVEHANGTHASIRVLGVYSTVVVGSQAILGSYDEDELPRAATASMEVDVAFSDDPDEVKADAVDGAIGELSQFHQTYGYDAQGVTAELAVLPPGWRTQVVQWSTRSTGAASAIFPDPHDLVVSKLVAGREKDLAFAHALVNAGLVDLAVPAERVAELEGIDARVVQRIRDALHSFRGLTPEAGPAPGRSGLPMPD